MIRCYVLLWYHDGKGCRSDPRSGRADVKRAKVHFHRIPEFRRKKNVVGRWSRGLGPWSLDRVVSFQIWSIPRPGSDVSGDLHRLAYFFHLHSTGRASYLFFYVTQYRFFFRILCTHPWFPDLLHSGVRGSSLSDYRDTKKYRYLIRYRNDWPADD